MADDLIPSFNSQLRELNRGESLAKAERFELGEEMPEPINDVLARMRRTVNAATSRVRAAVGSNFRVESGTMLTNDNAALIAVVSVTRI